MRRRTWMLMGLAILALVLMVPSVAMGKKPVKPPPDPEPDPDPAILYVGVVGKGKNLAHKPMMMNADGSNQTAFPFNGSELAWSPDGERVAYFAWDEDDQYALYVSNLAGTVKTRIVGVGTVLGRPAWSPVLVQGDDDNQYNRLAYTERVRSERDTNPHHDLYIVRVEDKVKTRLTTTTTLMEREPEWSPDGTKLVFKINDFEDLENRDLYGIYDLAATSEPYTIHEHQGGLSGLDVYFPSWSRTDASEILWAAWDGEQYDIWLVDLDDLSNPVQVTDTSSDSERWPSWSPDGSKIVYSNWNSNNGGESVEVMNADGTDVKILVEKGYRPRWCR